MLGIKAWKKSTQPVEDTNGREHILMVVSSERNKETKKEGTYARKDKWLKRMRALKSESEPKKRIRITSRETIGRKKCVEMKKYWLDFLWTLWMIKNNL